jgi:glycosyltransferase involved in cell wall biosynthesis
VRICLVSQEYPPESAHGGIGTQTWNKAHALTSLGHTVHVVSSGCAQDSSIRTQIDNRITVHRITPPGAESPRGLLPIYNHPAYLLGYTWSILESLHEIMKTEQFDLINFPEYSAEGFAYQLNRSEWNWLPVTVQLHGPLALFAHRQGWPDLNSEFYRVGSFMEGESIRLADSLMASSDNIADFAADFYQIPRSSIDVVHCGIDCGMFYPSGPDALLNQRPTVLFVGNLTAGKGLKTVFQAVLSLRSRYPDLQLQILGRGDTVSQELKTRAKKAGAEDALQLLGFVKERKALPQYYRSAHIFASPADHEPGVANVYVEAMACGLPVVASTSGGAPEAVRNGETGLLVPPRDVDATAEALDRLLSDSALRQRMGAAGRERVLEYFATEHYIKRVLSAYEKALNRSPQKLAGIQS